MALDMLSHIMGISSDKSVGTNICCFFPAQKHSSQDSMADYYQYDDVFFLFKTVI